MTDDTPTSEASGLALLIADDAKAVLHTDDGSSLGRNALALMIDLRLTPLREMLETATRENAELRGAVERLSRGNEESAHLAHENLQLVSALHAALTSRPAESEPDLIDKLNDYKSVPGKRVMDGDSDPLRDLGRLAVEARRAAETVVRAFEDADDDLESRSHALQTCMMARDKAICARDALADKIIAEDPTP